MAIDWKKVFGDKTAYPDDATFELGGEKLTFAELRKQNADSQGELQKDLVAREAKVADKERKQEQAVSTLATVLERVSKATGLSYDDLIAGRIPENLKTTVAAVTGDTRTASGAKVKEDPLFKDLFAEVLDPALQKVDLVARTLGQSINVYSNDHTRLAFLEYLQSPDKPADFKPDYKAALQVAVDKGYKEDGTGFPDVSRALRDMAGPVSHKSEIEQALEKGRAEGRAEAQRQQLAQLGEPQRGAGGIHFEAAPEKSAVKPGETIRQALDKAFNDPEIAGQMFGVTGTA
jgi:hypothetical protein